MSVPSGRLSPPLVHESMAVCTLIGRFTFMTASGHKSRLWRTFSKASWMHNIFGWCMVIWLLSSCFSNKSSIVNIELDQEYFTKANKPSSLNSIRAFFCSAGQHNDQHHFLELIFRILENITQYRIVLVLMNGRTKSANRSWWKFCRTDINLCVSLFLFIAVVVIIIFSWNHLNKEYIYINTKQWALIQIWFWQNNPLLNFNLLRWFRITLVEKSPNIFGYSAFKEAGFVLPVIFPCLIILRINLSSSPPFFHCFTLPILV